MKKIIKDFFALFGIGIYKIKKKAEVKPKPEYKPIKDFEVVSAFHHNTPERMNDFFSDPEHLENYMSEVRLEFYKQIRDYFKEKNIDLNDKEILDVGCGTGHLLMFISEYFKVKKMFGLDFSDAAVSVARENIPEGEFNVHDIYKAHDRKYDVIFCTEVLEHLSYPDEALNNLLQLMNKDSVLYLTTPNGRTDTYKGHINYWGPEGWELFIKKNCKGMNIETGLLVNSRFNYACLKNN
ncbi:MAG: class I SAM-dependent methyltransferase [Bacteroidetes bacterium]|nr:class I SAM-dependent methyltransferase [Bacteroidota bacterium]